MTLTTSDGADTGEALSEMLATSEGLHSLLGIAEVKAALVAEMRDLGVPAPGLVYRAIVFAAGRSESFLGAAVSSRLQAFVDRTPALAGLIQKILNLEHGAGDKAQLKAALITAIREDKPLNADIAVDDATPLEMAIALHSMRKQETIAAAVEALGQDLVESFRRDIAALSQDIFRPVLSWPEVATRRAELSAFDRLKYTSGIDQFLGRDQEIDFLHRFAGDPSFGGRIFNFRWLLLTGEGGMGKTRLAHHFTRKVLGQEWEAGKLDLHTLSGFAAPEKWRPRQPTFIVIDYAQTAPEEVRRLLRAFSGQAGKYEFPVRLLLLERSANAIWTNRMLPNDGDRPAVMKHGFGGRGVNGTGLAPLSRETIATLMTRRFDGSGCSPPSPDDLFEFAVQVDPREGSVEVDGATQQIPIPRPLFALAVADAVIESIQSTGAPPAELTREEVLEGIISRDRQTIWRAIVRDEPLRRRYERGLALATLVQGLKLSDLTEVRFGAAMSWLPPAPPNEDQAALAAFGCHDGVWPALEPDILGEFFVSEVLLEPTMSAEVRQAFLLGALELNSPQPIVTLLRLAHDFPHRFDDLGLPDVARACRKLETARDFADLSVNLTSITRDRTIRSAADLFDVVWGLFCHFKDHEIAVGAAGAAVNVSNRAGAAEDWDRVEVMLGRIDALRAAFPEHSEIALRAANAIVNVSNHAGAAGDWDRVEAMLTRIDALRATFPEDAEIALREAQAAVNISSFAGRVGDWNRVEAALGRIDALRGAFPEDPDIALSEAQAAFNISINAESAGDWNRVEAMLGRLNRLIIAFGGKMPIGARAGQMVTLATARSDVYELLQKRPRS